MRLFPHFRKGCRNPQAIILSTLEPFLGAKRCGHALSVVRENCEVIRIALQARLYQIAIQARFPTSLTET